MMNLHIFWNEFYIFLIFLKNVISNLSTNVFLVSLEINDIGSTFKVGGDSDKSNDHTVSILYPFQELAKIFYLINYTTSF